MRPTSAWSLLVTVICISAVTACAGDDEAPPTRLVDGSPAQRSPIVFEGVDVPVVVTRARRTRAAAQCGLGGGDGGVAVERVGVSGTSVSTYSARSRTIRACDGTTPGAWCGQAFARLRKGRPLDPRLSLTCRDARGRPVGFAWLRPGSDARYVVVTHDSHAEAYAVIADVPVRVTTLDVDVATSSAPLEVSEHSADGRRLDAYRLVAQVAG